MRRQNTLAGIASTDQQRKRSGRLRAVITRDHHEFDLAELVQEFLRAMAPTAAIHRVTPASIQLHVWLPSERLGNIPALIAVGLRPRLKTLAVAIHESAILAAGVGVRMDLEAAVEVDLVHVDRVVAALASVCDLYEDLVQGLLLGRHSGHAPRKEERDRCHRLSEIDHSKVPPLA